MKTKPKAIEPLVPRDGEQLLCVSLKESYNQDKAKGIYVRESDYEMTRKWWEVSDEMLPKITYVLGIYKAEVVTVLKPKPNGWIKTQEKPDGTLWDRKKTVFEGEMIYDSEYLGKHFSDISRKTAYCPKLEKQKK